MDNVPVTLIVKAPNQQFEDQTIQCELSWTIKRLKSYLTEVYPCKPTFDEQKLIYSGQLLTDAIILKDILRQYEGQDTHTVHLVFTPKNRILETSAASKSNVSQKLSQNATSTSSTTDGLRHRTNQTSTVFNNNQQQQQLPPTTTNVQNNLFQQQQTLIDQHRAMQTTLQQIYDQYLNRYMNGSVPPLQNQISNGVSPNYPAMPYSPQNIQYVPTVNSTLMGAAAAAYQQQQHHQQQPQQQPNVAGNIMHQQPLIQQPQPQPQLQQQQLPQQPQQDLQNPAAVGAPQPRFPNIVQEEVENRDWLDLFYAFSRLMILMTLVYFYSSPVRCLVVILFTFIYYLYHTGYFRQNNQEPNNNINQQVNIENNNNVRQQAAAAQPPQPAANNDAANLPNLPEQIPAVIDNAAEVGAAAAAAADENAPLLSSPAVDNQEQNNRTPVIALIRTFILSFFASLIPETPPL